MVRFDRFISVHWEITIVLQSYAILITFLETKGFFPRQLRLNQDGIYEIWKYVKIMKEHSQLKKHTARPIIQQKK